MGGLEEFEFEVLGELELGDESSPCVLLGEYYGLELEDVLSLVIGLFFQLGYSQF